MVAQQMNPLGPLRVLAQRRLVELASLRQDIDRFACPILRAQQRSELQERHRRGRRCPQRVIREPAQLVDRLIGITGLGDALGAFEHGLRRERTALELGREQPFIRLPRGLKQLEALGRLPLQRRHALLT